MLNWLLSFLLLLSMPVWAQQSSPNTYAVIAGISSYASKGIPALRFANKDAEAFYNYLRDDAKVPADHMKLLLNEEATTASVYSALSWLNETAQKDDLVYFYFSGHGDMESETIYKLGFLLTYNTPRTNYINNAIRIEDINNFANTLSLKNKAKVVIITDACHSGNLAGSDFRGNSLVGKQLSISKANEIRIASCRPDQLSMEDEGWGGGRGVFSFHLVNGLIGFAADPGKEVVTLRDLRSYLEKSFASDLILKRENHRQDAVFDGPANFPLAKRNTKRMGQVSQLATPEAGALPTVNAAGEDFDMALDKFGTWLKQQKLDSGFNYLQLEKSSSEKISGEWLQMMRQVLLARWEQWEELREGLKEPILRLEALQDFIKTDSSRRQEMDRLLLVALHDYAQHVINAYLEGDAGELERRRYYNAGASGYDIYPLMYKVAMQLASPDDPIYRLLELNHYYFGGIALLLKIPLAENPSTLIEQALTLENKALALEDQAAYIYNSLGVLHYYKENFAMADSMYRKAMELAPQWALPYNNLLALYVAQRDQTKAKTIFASGREKAAQFSDFYSNAGLLWEMEKDYLLAEEFQRKSITLNSRHYLPFERLGNIYTHTTNYALADSFFFEADVRKKGYHFKKFHQDFEPAPAGTVMAPFAPCYFDSTRIDSKNTAGYFHWGMDYYQKQDYAAARLKWNKVLQLDPKHPLVFYYLGKMLFEEKDWPAADIMFRFAAANYLGEKEAMHHQDSLLAVAKYKVECFRNIFFGSLVPEVNLYAFAGSLYREWQHYTEAETAFRKMVALNPGDFAANKVLWQMLENIGKYQDAEVQVKTFATKDMDKGERELNAFYKRMMERYPHQAEWFLKAGLFLYDLVKKHPTDFEEDRKRIFPDQQIPEKVLLPVVVEYSDPNPESLPGTLESIHSETFITRPYSDAITCFLKVDSLTGNNPMLTADINDKLGDLYVWQGVPEYAAIYYQASIEAASENAGVRLKLIDVYHATYQFTSALESLRYLETKQQLNFEKMILLSDYSMRQSKFSHADSLLAIAKTIYPYSQSTVLELQARNALLQEKANDAIKKYETLLLTDTKNAAAMYSISRMFALKGDKANNMRWLHKAYDHGFHYKWVLEKDPLMTSMRTTSDWQQFINNKKFMQYPEPTNTLPRFTE